MRNTFIYRVFGAVAALVILSAALAARTVLAEPAADHRAAVASDELPVDKALIKPPISLLVVAERPVDELGLASAGGGRVADCLRRPLSRPVRCAVGDPGMRRAILRVYRL